MYTVTCFFSRLLWRFVSKFTEYDAKKLHKFYRKTKKQELQNQVNSELSEKNEKDGKKEKEKKPEDRSQLKRSHDGDNSDYPNKKSYNG